jgi:hypothetical protein
MKSKISILTAILALTVVSCLKNDIVWESENAELRTLEFAAPIVKIHVPLYETMKKEFDFDDLFVNSEGVICVQYTKSEVIEWNNDIGIQRYDNFDKPWQAPITAGTINTQFPPFAVHLQSHSPDKSGTYIKKAELASGEIKFSLTGLNVLSNGYVTITIPELTNRQGDSFTEIITLPTSQTDYNYNLEGYTIETDNNHNLNVEFAINATATSAGSLYIQFEIFNFEVSFLSGYFGEIIKTEEYEIEFDFFNELDFDGTFGFRDIAIDAKVTNMAGLPMNVKADIFFVDENALNEKLNLTPPFNFDVSSATISNNDKTIIPAVETFPTMTLTEIEFKNGVFPNKLKFEIEGKTNYVNGSLVTDVENFVVKDDNNILAEVDFTLTAPLYVKIGGYSRTDTIGFNFNDIISDDEDFPSSVDNMMINLAIVNNLPFEITLEAFAVDDAGNYVETVLNSTIITGGTQKVPIHLIQRQLELFRTADVKNIVLHTIAKTVNEDYVKIKADSYLDISVSINFKSSIPN